MTPRSRTPSAKPHDRPGPGAAPPPRWPSDWLPLMVTLLLFAIAYSGILAHPRMLGWDESEYAGIGRDWLRGAGYQTYGHPEAMRLPVVPAMVAATLAVAPHGGDTALRVMALAATLVMLLGCARAAARLTDPTTALVATLLLGAMPMTQVLAPLVLSEAPFALAFTVAVWAFHAGLDGRPRAYLACGIATGIALLTRYNSWLVLPVAALMLLARLTTTGPRELMRRTVGTRGFWTAPLAAIVILAPWFIRTWVVFGDPFEGIRESLDTISVYGNAPWTFYLERLPLIAGWPALLAALGGLVIVVRARSGIATTALITCVVVIAAHSRWLHKEDRYVSAMLPSLALLAALAITRATTAIAGALRVPGFAPLAAPAVALAAALATFGSPAVREVGFSPAGDPTLMRAMAVVRDDTPPGAIVIGASGPILHWYADRPVRAFPAQPSALPGMLPGAAWVAFVNFERMQPEWAPDLTRRLTAEDEARGDVRVFRDGPSQVVLVRAATLARALEREPVPSR